jgi:hypothetical protein
MRVPVLEAIADAIYRFNGAGATCVAYRNRNPGLLRRPTKSYAYDSNGDCVFESFVEGYNALLHDLESKIFHRGSPPLNFHSPLRDLLVLHARDEIPFRGEECAISVARWLCAVYDRSEITPMTTFRQLYAFAREDKPSGVPAD